MLGRALALLCAAAALAGCGGAGADGGEATLWVTRDRGAQTLVDAEVAAGQTLMRALRGEADVETRFGGRFVQAIDGVHGGLAAQRDWFWWVNGIEGDRSIAEYRLRDGDVAWLDFRSWAEEERVPVVVGAFPEPFLHGWDGHVRPTAVRHAPGLADDARRIAELLGASSVEPAGTPVADEANLFVLADGGRRFTAAQRTPGGGAGAPVVFTFAGDVDALLAGEVGRRRYAVP
jgi:hypothetical protein